MLLFIHKIVYLGWFSECEFCGHSLVISNNVHLKKSEIKKKEKRQKRQEIP